VLSSPIEVIFKKCAGGYLTPNATRSEFISFEIMSPIHERLGAADRPFLGWHARAGPGLAEHIIDAAVATFVSVR
jgi:hypothetical protein